jgi:threonine synthase
VLPDLAAVTMGEGETPVVEVDGVVCKLEYLAPTLSFKDRGAVVLAAVALERDERAAVCDSSGNAGAAVAAYFGRAGIPVAVYVPAAAPARKLAAIEAYGATLHRVEGDRAAVARAAAEEVDRTGAFYASHVYNPLFVEGTAGFGRELDRSTEAVVVPYGNGSLALGAWIGAQAAGFGPRLIVVRAPARPTVADGIAIDDPPRGPHVLAAVTASGGAVVDVTETEILAARDVLAAHGIWAEPTGAVAYAGWVRIGRPPAAVVAVTGAGAKSA